MAKHIPVTTDDGEGLREWDVTTKESAYFIRDDCGDWTLYRCTGPNPATDWEEIGYGTDVDAFLTAHRLILEGAAAPR